MKKVSNIGHRVAFSCDTIPYEWRDFGLLTDADKKELVEKYNLHALTIADIVSNTDKRSRVHIFSGYVFISLRILRQKGLTISAHRIEVCISKDWILTFHAEQSGIIPNVFKEIESDYPLDCLTPSKVLYLLVRHSIAATYPIIDDFEERIDVLENAVVHTPAPYVLEDVFKLKEQIIRARTIMAPMRDAINTLSSIQSIYIDPDHKVYFNDCFETILRMNESFDSMRDLLSSVLDTYLSVVSFRANEVIKRLTIVATVFLPASFLAALGGINFTDFPFHNHLMFVVFIASIISLPIGLYAYFRAYRLF